MRRELLSLLVACKQHAEDEAARGVLADWLEEHGDDADRERAAFLRLELASGLEHGRPEFHWRRMHVWSQNEARWAPYQADLKRADRAWADGGLVSTLASVKGLSSEKGRRWAGTEAWAWVRRLRVAPKPAELPAVMDSPLLDGVPELDLSGVSLGGDAAESLARCRKLAGLHSLWLSHATLGEKGLTPLLGSPYLAGLRSLHIRGARPTLDDFHTLADPDNLPALEEMNLAPRRLLDREMLSSLGLRPLRSFTLDGCEEGDALVGLFNHVPPGLRRLRLAGSSWDRPTLDAFAGSGMLETLEELDLSAARFLCVAPWAVAPRLRVLRLKGASFDAADWLGRIGAGELAFLDLRNTGWSDASLVTALPAAPLALDMAGYKLEDAGLIALARWAGFARCRVLNLYDNRITAGGVRALVESPYAAGLRSLSVPDNAIGDAGVEAIAASPVAANLEELQVHKTQCGERAARALLASKGLTRIKDPSLGLNLPRPLAAALAERFGPALC